MKINKSEFEQFKKDCLYWKDKYGLHDWEVYFEHKKLDGNWAETAWDIQSMKATIFLSDEYDKTWDTVKNLPKTAHHEILHLLFVPILASITDDKYRKQTCIDEHRIINQILNAHHEKT